MTRFDINKVQRSPEEWSAIAFEQTTENNIQWTVIGGLTLGIVAAAATNPITGILIGAWAIFTSIGKAKEVARNQKAIREYGCIAHVLEDDDFQAYARQVGQDACFKELSFAHEQGYSFSNTALNYMDVVAPSALSASNSQIRVLQTQPQTQSDIYQIDTSVDIIGQMTGRIGNCLIIGTPGSGKGMLLANAIRAAKAKYPDLKVFVIDPKASEQESGYFEGAADVVKLFKCETANPQEVVEWLEKCFKEYYQYWEKHRRVLLVLDEGTLVGSKAKSDIVKNTVVALASAGDGEGRNIWITSLSPYVGDLGINLNASSQLTAYAILTKNNLGSLKQWGRSSILEKITVGELSDLVNKSPCDRAIFSGVSSKWYSMPTLHNYSAFDRDNRKPTGDALSASERKSLRTATGLSQAQILIQKLEVTTAATIEEFITKDLKSSKVEELREAIRVSLEGANRQDLLNKFFPKS